MPVVKIDKKGRIQLPRVVRRTWNLRPKQSLDVEIHKSTLVVRKSRKLDSRTDPLLRDILISPGRSKVKVTKKLLEKLEEEAWKP